MKVLRARNEFRSFFSEDEERAEVSFLTLRAKIDLSGVFAPSSSGPIGRVGSGTNGHRVSSPSSGVVSKVQAKLRKALENTSTSGDISREEMRLNSETNYYFKFVCEDNADIFKVVIELGYPLQRKVLTINIR